MNIIIKCSPSFTLNAAFAYINARNDIALYNVVKLHSTS